MGEAIPSCFAKAAMGFAKRSTHPAMCDGMCDYPTGKSPKPVKPLSKKYFGFSE
jgi:hypothetical protein